MKTSVFLTLVKYYDNFMVPSHQIPFLLAFHRSFRLTYHRFKRLSKFFNHDFQKAWSGNAKDLKAAGIDAKARDKWISNHKTIVPNQELENLLTQDIDILVQGSTEYPLPLETIHDPPALLFVKGSFEKEDFPSIGVVGSRKISPYGKKALNHLISPLAQAGLTITSGLAFGTDFLAHTTATDNSARTVGVLGSSIDRIYPNSHTKWVEKHLENESLVLVSEWLPGTPLIPEHFPMRNRIIAGLSKCLVVIEGTKKSGSLITARLANEQGKDTFALPGDIFSKLSQGPNQLILDGVAHPLTSSEDILNYLGIKTVRSQQKAKKILPQIGLEADIMKCFPSSEPQHIDDLQRQSSIAQHQLSSTLILLEMKGLIKNIGAQKYIKNV